MKTIGLLISGIGFEEGTSVWDVAYILKEIERCNCKPLPMVPRESVERKISGPRRKNAPMRNFAVEADLLVRGNVFYIDEIDHKALDALIIPGGKGSITILSSILRDGTEAQVLPEVRELIAGIFATKKAIGTMGYSATLVTFVLRARIEPIVTVGDDAQMVELIKRMGADAVKVQAHEVIFDESNRIISTPGTSPKASLYRASLGIETLMNEILECEKQIKNP